MALPLPSAPTPRGACPSLARPMASGDGLLVRLRPWAGSLTPGQLRALCAAAGRHGSGILEITARGSLQLRGLRPGTVGPLAAEVEASGIALAGEPAVETPPLAGFDPEMSGDALGLARSLATLLATGAQYATLGAKFSVIVDGGGRFHLGEQPADLRLTAQPLPGARRWRLALAGDERSASPLALLTPAEAVESVGRILDLLVAQGRGLRGRDLDPDLVRHSLGRRSAAPEAARQRPVPPPAGLHDFGKAGCALGVALPFGQTAAAVLASFLREAEDLGAEELRLAPGRAFFLLGLSPAAAERAAELARRAGFLVRGDAPATQVAACAGAGACGSGLFETKSAAAAILEAVPDLLDGSFPLHLSGCPKGCARAAPAALTVVGAPSGYGVVVNATASAPPDLYIGHEGLIPAIERLAALLRREKLEGETTAACLARLGRDRAVASLQQER